MKQKKEMNLKFVFFICAVIILGAGAMAYGVLSNSGIETDFPINSSSSLISSSINASLGIIGNMVFNPTNAGIGANLNGQGYNFWVNGTSLFEYGDVLFYNNRNTSLTNGGTSAIYSTQSASPFAYPFNANGNLVIQPRTSAPSDIVFETGSTTPSVRMIINSSGYVGIGTNSPDSILTIKNSATSLNVSGNFYANSTNVWINNLSNMGFTGSGATSCVIHNITNGIITGATCS